MLYMAKATACSETHIKHMNTLYRQNTELLLNLTAHRETVKLEEVNKTHMYNRYQSESMVSSFLGDTKIRIIYPFTFTYPNLPPPYNWRK
jgi:hypothetical protein